MIQLRIEGLSVPGRVKGIAAGGCAVLLRSCFKTFGFGFLTAKGAKLRQVSATLGETLRDLAVHYVYNLVLLCATLWF